MTDDSNHGFRVGYLNLEIACPICDFRQMRKRKLEGVQVITFYLKACQFPRSVDELIRDRPNSGVAKACDVFVEGGVYWKPCAECLDYEVV